MGGACSATVHGPETYLWAKEVFLKPTSGDSYFLPGILNWESGGDKEM